MSLTFVDLFAGCGGLSLGLIQSGMRGICAVEKNASAFSTLKVNLIEGGKSRSSFDWPQWLPRSEMGIETFVDKHVYKFAEQGLQVDVIAGGPPCQGFSTGGKRDANDPRNFLFEQYLATVEKLKPKFLLLENVAGIARPFAAKPLTKPKATQESDDVVFSTLIRTGLEKLGYKIVQRVYDASEYGVPQHRMRFIMVGCRLDIWEEKGLTEDQLEVLSNQVRTEHMVRLGLDSNIRTTVAQAISDLEIERAGTEPSVDTKRFQQIKYKGPRTKFQRLMHLGNEGASPNSLRIPQHRTATVEQFKKIIDSCEAGRNLSLVSRLELGIQKNRTCLLSADLPSRTVTTLPDDFVHYSEPRTLTVREAARLQSFPDWFEFHGPYTTGGKLRKYSCPRYTQVGNAVPVLFANYLGALLQQIEEFPAISSIRSVVSLQAA